jgi:hypothetical protein
MEKKMVKVFCIFKMVVNLMAYFLKIKNMALENLNSRMEIYFNVIGFLDVQIHNAK